MPFTDIENSRSSLINAVDVYKQNPNTIALSGIETAGKGYMDVINNVLRVNPVFDVQNFFSTSEINSAIRDLVMQKFQGTVEEDPVTTVPFTEPTFARHFPDVNTVFQGPPVLLDPIYNTRYTVSSAAITIGENNIVEYEQVIAGLHGSHGGSTFNGYILTGLTSFTSATVLSGPYGDRVSFSDHKLFINLIGLNVPNFILRIQLS